MKLSSTLLLFIALEALKYFHYSSILKLERILQMQSCLALVFEYAIGGELYTMLKKTSGGVLSENEAKFYFVEIALALQYLHESVGIIYR